MDFEQPSALYDSESPDRRQPLSYGRLSDQLLWSLIAKRALCLLPRAFRFCDAGGGSGRWSLRILEEYAEASGIMLCGERSAAAAGGDGRPPTHDRLDVVTTDLFRVPDKSFDLTFSLHDMLALTEQPANILSQLVRITKPSGLVVLLVPNLYHAIFHNLGHARVREAERALSGRACYYPGAPELNVFTPRSLEEMVTRAGACPRTTVGFPMVVHPWSAELESPDLLSEALANEESRREILAIEEALLTNSGTTARGSELLSIATVPPMAQRWGDFWLAD